VVEMVKSKTSLAIISSILIVLISVAATYLGLVSLGYVHTNGIKIEIQLKASEKLYDGTPLLATEYELTSGSLSKGDELIVIYTGGQTNAGTSISTANVYVHDKDGYDVTKNYTISVKGAELKVNARSLTIKLNPNEKVYDGTPLSETTFDITDGELVPGHKLVPSFKTSVSTSIDDALASMTAEIYDENGKNVTKNYALDIDNTEAELRIEKRPVVITSLSASKVFDGEVLSNPNFTQEGLLEGHKFVITAPNLTACLTDVGTIDNDLAAEYDIYDENGVSVKDEYQVIYQNVGKLTITPYIINVTTASKSATYNGKEQTFEFDVNKLISANDMAFLEKHSYTVKLGAAVTKIDAGSYENKPHIIVEDENGEVSNNISFNITAGLITINKKMLVVHGESISIEYSGSAVRSKTDYGNFNLNETRDLCENHKLIAFYTESSKIASIGTVSNDIASVYIEDNITGKNVTDNYDPIYVSGTLEMTKRKITISTPKLADIVYGYEINIPEKNYIISNVGSLIFVDISDTSSNYDFVVDDKFVLDEGYIPAGTQLNNFIDLKITDKAGNDVSKYFDIVFEYSEFEILKREVTITLPDIKKAYDKTDIYTIPKDKIMTSPTENLPSATLDGMAIGERLGLFDYVMEHEITPGRYKEYTIASEDIFVTNLTEEQLKYVDKREVNLSDNYIFNILSGKCFLNRSKISIMWPIEGFATTYCRGEEASIYNEAYNIAITNTYGELKATTVVEKDPSTRLDVVTGLVDGDTVIISYSLNGDDKNGAGEKTIICNITILDKFNQNVTNGYSVVDYLNGEKKSYIDATTIKVPRPITIHPREINIVTSDIDLDFTDSLYDMDYLTEEIGEDNLYSVCVDYDYFGKPIYKPISETEFKDVLFVSETDDYYYAGTYDNVIRFDLSDPNYVLNVSYGKVRVGLQIILYDNELIIPFTGKEFDLTSYMVNQNIENDLAFYEIIGLQEDRYVKNVSPNYKFTAENILPGLTFSLGSITIVDSHGNDVTNEYQYELPKDPIDLSYQDVSLSIIGGTYHETFNGGDLYFDSSNIKYSTNLNLDSGYGPLPSNISIVFDSYALLKPNAGTYNVTLDVIGVYYNGIDLTQFEFFEYNVEKDMTCIIDKIKVNIVTYSKKFEYGTTPPPNDYYCDNPEFEREIGGIIFTHENLDLLAVGTYTNSIIIDLNSIVNYEVNLTYGEIVVI